MITVAWVNFTNTDKRGPEKRFIEYIVYLSEFAKEEIKVIALFPFYTQDTEIFNIFDKHHVTYYEIKNSHYGHLFSPKTTIRTKAYKSFIDNIEDMKTILKNNKCDVVVSNCSMIWEAAFAAKALGLRHILFLRGIFNPCDIPSNILEKTMLRFMEKKLLELSDCIVTQSEYTAKLWGVNESSFNRKIIPVATELVGDYQPGVNEYTPVQVLILGGIEKNKNPEMVLQVAAQLKARGYEIVFNIYGNHTDLVYKQFIEQQITHLQLTQQIQIHPYEADINKVYKENDIVFIPSHLESFGIVACEAMGRCKPIISTRCGGPEEIVIHGKTGYLIEVTQVEEIVETFIILITQPQMIQDMGQAGRKIWEEKYEASIIMREWIKLLKDEGKKSSRIEQNINALLLQVGIGLAIPDIETRKYMMKGKTCKNWLIVSKSIHSPSVKLGMTNGLEVLQEQGRVNFKLINYTQYEQYLDWADCIIFSRAMDEDKVEFLKEAKKLGKKALYYADDSLYEVPNFAKANKNYNSDQSLKSLDYFIENTDLFIGCSKWILRSYQEKYQCKGIDLTPAIKKPIITGNKKISDQIVMGFAGNVDYEFFIERMKDMFIKLHQNYGNRIKFEFFGPKVSFLDEINGVYFPSTEYEYYEMVLARRNWDIGIAYLEESAFTNKKFYNKYLEYSRFGICGIYSDIELFRRIITPECNGLLAQNNLEDWYTQIERLIQDEKLRKRMAKSAQEHALKMFSPENSAMEIEIKLREFL